MDLLSQEAFMNTESGQRLLEVDGQEIIVQYTGESISEEDTNPLQVSKKPIQVKRQSSASSQQNVNKTPSANGKSW